MINYTDKIDVFDESGIPVTFILYKSGSSKLNLVKIIKTFTGLGLRDSKDIVDKVVDCPTMFTMRMSLEKIKQFRSELLNTDAEFDLNDIEKIRNQKLIDLGLYEKSDLIDGIIDMDINKIISNGFSLSKMKEVLNIVYSNISEDKLKEIYKNYKN